MARPLTFGIEFEFLVAGVRGNADPHREDTRWTAPFNILAVNPDEDSEYSPEEELESLYARVQEYIMSLLAENQIPALSGHRYEQLDISYVKEEVVEQGVQPPPSPGHIASHAFWMVSDDIGIQMLEEEDVDGYEYAAVEVASRILPETEFREVEAVYSLIQDNIRTQVNSSCGLHCHVGISHLSLESVKKLVTLLMVAEHSGLFDALCARHRSSPVNRWCQPVAQLSRAVMHHQVEGSQSRDHPSAGLAHHLPEHHRIPDALRLGLRRIWNCATAGEVATETLTWDGGLLPGADTPYIRRGGFALRVGTSTDYDITGEVVPADPTVEFRYKESTGCAGQDRRWLRLCLGLVRGAEWPRDRFSATLGALSTANTLEGLLRCLGVGEDEVQAWLVTARQNREHPTPAKRTRFLGP